MFTLLCSNIPYSQDVLYSLKFIIFLGSITLPISIGIYIGVAIDCKFKVNSIVVVLAFVLWVLCLIAFIFCPNAESLESICKALK